MSAPSLMPVWDTNLTHTTVDIASGHKTDGYGSNEVPASDELNTLLAYLCLWVSYLSKRATRTTMIHPASGQVAYQASPPSTGWYSNQGFFFAQNINDTLILPLARGVGDHITAAGANVAASSGFLWDVSLWKYDSTVNTPPTQVGTTQTSTHAGTAQTLTIGSLNETVAANIVYFITCAPHTGSTTFGSAVVLAAFVTYDIPAI